MLDSDPISITRATDLSTAPPHPAAGGRLSHRERIRGRDHDPLRTVIRRCQALDLPREVAFVRAVRAQLLADFGAFATPDLLTRTVDLIGRDPIVRRDFDLTWDRLWDERRHATRGQRWRAN